MNVQIKNEFLTATFDTLGAELISLKSDEREYIWEGNPEFWEKHAPILFPIIGSLKDDTYFFENKEYHLPRHGFARDKQFKIVNQLSDRITFSLQQDADTLKTFPFSFELQIEYVLLDKTLEVLYRVQNNSDCNMYFSIGGHPAFALPKSFEEYNLVFESDHKLRFSLLENGLLSPKTELLKLDDSKIGLNYSLFEKDALVFKNQAINAVTIQESGTDFIKVSFKGFPDLGIWTKVNASFICIEPWFGHADNVGTNQQFKDKDGIIKLNRDKLFQSVFTIEIL